MPSLIERWFSTAEILAIWNESPLEFKIQGGLPVESCSDDPEPHTHVFVEVGVQMFGIPPKATVEEAVTYFGWELVRQVCLVYLTSNVPDEIEWVGHVKIGVMDN